MASMNATLEPRIVAARTQRAAARLQGLPSARRMTASSQGGEAAVAMLRVVHEARNFRAGAREGTVIARFTLDLAMMRRSVRDTAGRAHPRCPEFRLVPGVIPSAAREPFQFAR